MIVHDKLERIGIKRSWHNLKCHMGVRLVVLSKLKKSQLYNLFYSRNSNWTSPRHFRAVIAC